MKKRFRAWVCRAFALTPNEFLPPPASVPEPVVIFAPTGWDDLWEVKDKRIVWPRLVKSDVWRNDLEPFFKKSLLATFFLITRETGADEASRENLRRLQERAKLINDWLEQPKIALMMDEAAYENARHSSRERFEQEKDRANGRG